MIRSLFVLLSIVAPVSAEGVPLPNGDTLKTVDFERHVSPLFQRYGCSTGGCHGAFQGRGGFRLSLFGDDSASDHRALTRDSFGRRLDRENARQSLLVLKPTGQLAHDGGLRFERESWPERLLSLWIEQGSRHTPGSGEVTKLEVEPGEHRFSSSESKLKVKVFATFADGTREDVTPFSDLKLRDESVVALLPGGMVMSRSPGDTTLIVNYRGQLATVSLFVPRTLPSDVIYPLLEERNVIDREVFRRLRSLNVIPSDPTDDAEFLRRVYLDTIGSPPSPDEVRAFLTDQRIDKRLRKIDELLTHPLHAALWATRWSDITGNRVEVMEGSPEQRVKQSKMYHDWFRQRFAENVGWDRIARGILTATSREEKEIREWMSLEGAFNDSPLIRIPSAYADRVGLDLFWRRTVGESEFFPIEQMAELTASTFLGVRVECAQCHKHPFDRWTQSDYRSFANLFGQLKYGRSKEQISATAKILDERRAMGKGEIPFPRVKELYSDDLAVRKFSHPETREPLPARILGGPLVRQGADARLQFADWLTAPDNPFFARSFVNRVWAHYFGVGIVDPVDNFSLANPPSNEALLNVMSTEFINSGYDIRHLERLILSSATYQLSSRPNESNARDLRNFSHARPRKLMAEAMVDLLNASLEMNLDFGPDVPKGSHAIEVAPNRIRDPHITELFRIFGRPQRASVCDCERSSDITLSQTLYLMTSSPLLKGTESGRLKRLLASEVSDGVVLEELFLATLCRFPTEDDLRIAREHLSEEPDRATAFRDLLWAIVNSREFVLNH